MTLQQATRNLAYVARRQFTFGNNRTYILPGALIWTRKETWYRGPCDPLSIRVGGDVLNGHDEAHGEEFMRSVWGPFEEKDALEGIWIPCSSLGHSPGFIHLLKAGASLVHEFSLTEFQPNKIFFGLIAGLHVVILKNDKPCIIGDPDYAEDYLEPSRTGGE